MSCNRIVLLLDPVRFTLPTVVGQASLRLLPLLVLVCCGNCNRTLPNETPAGEQLPNIVFILTDDQGYGDLSAHGNPWLKTPHLDALHDQSVRFSNFHAGTTCAPTRAGLMSGVNCNRAGAWHTIGGRSMLGERFETLADQLKAKGYATGIFGKWHLGDNFPFRPQNRGFDEVLIHGGGGVGQTPDAWNNDYFDDRYFHNGTPERYAGYCTDVWFAESMKFMRERAAQDQPFFAYIATNAPHGPYHVEEKYVTSYRNNDAIPNPNFCGMIANIDDNVGKLMNLLRSSGLEDNTLVVFMTDNGTSSGAALDSALHVIRGYNAGMRGRKGSEYEGGHRVPLFMKFPAKHRIAPVAYDQLTAYTDVMPTLLDYVDGTTEVAHDLDGESLWPLISSGKQPALDDRYVIVDTQREQLPVKGKQSCVMQGPWRLINGTELYDLSQDPGQREDLASRAPQRVSAMQAAYETWWAGMTEDLKVLHRIAIGNPAEPTTLLTAHDWHTDDLPPWNQGYIREGRVDNGWWALHAARAGRYRIRLYRYPPDSGLAFGAEAPAGEAIPNGEPYSRGVSIEPVVARYTIAGVTETKEATVGMTYFEFTVELPPGPTELQTWVTDTTGVERGAYYVTVEAQ